MGGGRPVAFPSRAPDSSGSRKGGRGGGAASFGNLEETSLSLFFAFARNNPESLPDVEAMGSVVRPLFGHRARISGAAFMAVLVSLLAKNRIRIQILN